MKDHYQTLGLGRSASEKQIKQAYRELCKQYHPDHNKSPDAHARMQEINEAHRVLASRVSRAEYDQLLRLQEQQRGPTTDAASAAGTTEQCRCEKCGRVDPTLRVTVFTWVVSFIVVTYRNGWAKILCARCRTKYALLFDLQNFFMGWWGIPFGLFWTLRALWHNSLGGLQPEENNALFLAGLGYEFHRKGNLKAAASALKASLRFKNDPRVEAFYWQTQARFHETSAACARELGPSLWQRLATGAFHPAVYCAPMLALLFGLASVWLESENKSPVRARSGAEAHWQDDVEKVKRLREAADQGFAEDQFELGYHYAYGCGKTKYPVEAVKWYRKAAEQGFFTAQLFLGSCYADGDGVHKDYVVAYKWLSIASAQYPTVERRNLSGAYKWLLEIEQLMTPEQIAEAQRLAREFTPHKTSQSAPSPFANSSPTGAPRESELFTDEYGNPIRLTPEQEAEAIQLFKQPANDQKVGVQLFDNKEYARAFEPLRRAAKSGQPKPQYYLASCYLKGLGVSRDAVEAVNWYRKAAEQGYAVAQSMLGICCHNGEGVTKDEVEAVNWYRKAAEQGEAAAQCNLGGCYFEGNGVMKDVAEAEKWYRKASEQGLAEAQFMVGRCLLPDFGGEGAKDAVEAVKWYRKAAEQGHVAAQTRLGFYYSHGIGVTWDGVEAVKWYREAAMQGDATAQVNLGYLYANGDGVPKDYIEAHKWLNLASAQNILGAKQKLPEVEQLMMPQQIAEAQRLARDFRPRNAPQPGDAAAREGSRDSHTAGSGTGFFITQDGFLVTNEHVVKEAAQIRVVTSAGILAARVVRVDSVNDLALLKAEGWFKPLPVANSRMVRLGNNVATIGFPNLSLQGFAPKLAKGEIAALSGAQDDPRYFQISVPVQPGNSGGGLVDERGNVVGVVSAKLSAAAALAASGTLPENVNYAVKSSILLSFLESVPEVSAKLKQPNARERKFEQVARDAQDAAALVLVY